MQSIQPTHTESLMSLISESIDDRFGKAKYLDHEVIIMKSNGYINMTKLCDQYGKRFRSWKQNKTSDELVQFISTTANIPANDLFVEIVGGQQMEIRGTYIHQKLTPHIASWISPKVAVIIQRISDSYQQNALLFQQQATDLQSGIHKINITLAEQLLENDKQQQIINQIHQNNNIKLDFITFNGKQCQIYGDSQNPLFLANDIIVSLLGYRDIDSNRFYKDNKHNSKYILSRQAAVLETSAVEWQDRERLLLTELGLYRCLFQSKKPLAIDFQEQVSQLLKDIRLGNIKLAILQKCEFAQQIQDKQNDILSYITQTSKLNQQITELQDQLDSLQEDLQQKEQLISKCKKVCSLYKQVVTYPDQSRKEYAGSSINPTSRNKQHRSNSSNRGLKQAIINGYDVQFELIDTFIYYTEVERRQKERELILSIPQQNRLNRVVPRV